MKKLQQLARIYRKQQTSVPTFQFGVRLPRSVKDAYALDRTNGNQLWTDAIQKELDELLLYETFRVLPRRGLHFHITSLSLCTWCLR